MIRLFDRFVLLAPVLALAAAANLLAQNGAEFGVVIKDSVSPDGKMAVMCTGRKAGAKDSAWPATVWDNPAKGTPFSGDVAYTTDNWVVSLADKKKLGRVRSDDPGFQQIFSDFVIEEDFAEQGFSALWGPEQEGWYYGVLNYDARWGCSDIFLVNCDGAEAKISSIKAALDQAVEGIVKKKAPGSDPGRFLIGYSLDGAVDPQASVAVGDPLSVRIGYVAQIPKDDDSPVVEGALTVTFGRNARGEARVESMESAPSGSAASSPVSASASSAEDFAALRSAWTEKSKSGDWKKVRKDLPDGAKGGERYLIGWLEANVLQRLLYVDSESEKDGVVVIYYWKDGQLVSVFELRRGAATQISEVAEATEIYNFSDEKLVGWLRSGDGESSVDPAEDGFQEKGREVLKESIRRAEPIYELIGAD